MRQPLGGGGIQEGINPFADPPGVGPEGPAAWPSKQEGRFLGQAGNFIASAILPWLCFTFIIALFTFAYQEFSQLVWALVAASVLLAVLFLIVGGSDGRAEQLALGALVLVSVAIAVPVGIFIESNHMEEYWRLDYGASYQQVDPYDPGNTRSDAVIMQFTEGTYIDVQKTIGYMKRGTVYCVAPVSGLGQSTKAQYWVAGLNCCGARGDFECDSVYDEQAKSGVVLEQHSDEYSAAVAMAQSVYGLQGPASPPVFLHWTADPAAFKDKEYTRSATYVLVASVVHLVCCFLAVCLFVRSCGALRAK
jgi:hypothetical protein